MRNINHKSRGQAALELALLFPTLFVLLFSFVQIIIYIQAKTALNFASFQAARSYQVYGRKTLGELDYPYLSSDPLTNKHQAIVEASAERIIFESLMWEKSRIEHGTSENLLHRYYRDGNDLLIQGQSTELSEGAVRADIQSGNGVTVTYCVPIIVPGISSLFALAREDSPCRVSRNSPYRYQGIALRKKVGFGIEPGVSP